MSRFTNLNARRTWVIKINFSIKSAIVQLTHFRKYCCRKLPRLDHLNVTLAALDEIQFVGAEIIGVDLNTTFIISEVNAQYMVISLSAENSATIDELLFKVRSRADVVANLPLTQKARLGLTSSGKHSLGSSKSQSNVYDTGSTYTAADVSGEAYCYIVSPQLHGCQNQRIANTEMNQAILSKVQLTTTAGYIDFNKALPFDCVWTKGKEVDLTFIDLHLVDTHHQSLSFQGLEYSGTLLIQQALPACPALLRQITDLEISE